MTLRRIIRTWFWFVLLCMLAGGGAGFGVSFLIPATYASTVSMIIAPPASTGTPMTINDIQVSQALAPTYAELASTRTLLDRVIATTAAQTTADKLASAITTHVPVGTSLLQITVTDRNADSAAAIANAIAAELAKYDLQGQAAQTTLRLSVVDPAVPGTKPQGLGTVFTAAVGGVAGLMLAVGFAFVVENLRREGAAVARA